MTTINKMIREIKQFVCQCYNATLYGVQYDYSKISCKIWYLRISNISCGGTLLSTRCHVASSQVVIGNKQNRLPSELLPTR